MKRIEPCRQEAKEKPRIRREGVAFSFQAPWNRSLVPFEYINILNQDVKSRISAGRLAPFIFVVFRPEVPAEA